MTLEEYLTEAFCEFINDPSDSTFQRGYLAALLAVAHDLEPAVYAKYKDLEDQCLGTVAQ